MFLDIFPQSCHCLPSRLSPGLSPGSHCCVTPMVITQCPFGFLPACGPTADRNPRVSFLQHLISGTSGVSVRIGHSSKLPPKLCSSTQKAHCLLFSHTIGASAHQVSWGPDWMATIRQHVSGPPKRKAFRRCQTGKKPPKSLARLWGPAALLHAQEGGGPGNRAPSE